MVTSLMFDGENFVHCSHEDLALSQLDFSGRLNSTAAK
jgi:hypothetical protein